MGDSSSSLSPADCLSYAQSTQALEGEGVVCRGHEDHPVHVSGGSLSTRVTCRTLILPWKCLRYCRAGPESATSQACWPRPSRIQRLPPNSR